MGRAGATETGPVNTGGAVWGTKKGCMGIRHSGCFCHQVHSWRLRTRSAGQGAGVQRSTNGHGPSSHGVDSLISISQDRAGNLRRHLINFFIYSNTNVVEGLQGRGLSIEGKELTTPHPCLPGLL